MDHYHQKSIRVDYHYLHPSECVEMAGLFQPPVSERTSQFIFMAIFYLREVKKNMISSLPSNLNHEILSTANDIFLTKIRINQ